MNQSTHPSTALLADYIDTPESTDFNVLRQHLSQCTECRNLTMKLTKLNHNITHYLPRFLEPELKPGLELDNQNELKSALHAATHSAAMHRHLNSTVYKEVTPHIDQAHPQNHIKNSAAKTTKPNKPPRKGLIEKITDFLTLAPPVWISIPVTATFVFTLTLMFFPASDKRADITLVAYQDNPLVVFDIVGQVVPPGIGFFNDFYKNANQKQEPFNSISVALKKDDSLHMKWSPITNASSYIINLYLIDGADKKLIGELKVKTEEAVFLDSGLQSGRRYEWLITGKTTDNFSFETKGGFIVADTDVIN